MDRRQFLGSSLAATLACQTLPAWQPSSSNRRVGLIGAGWYGKIDLIHLMQVEPVEVVSVCDVDSEGLAVAAELFGGRNPSGKRPKTFADYRQALQQVQHDLVIVGTPDHWHALPTIAALKSGADVYCEKPTAVDVLESKAMLDCARQLDRRLQIGTQRRRIPHILKAKQEIIETGKLGDIALVEMGCYYHMRNRKTAEQAPDQAPPATLDYQAWTGPAPMRPYNPIVHPRGWRAFEEYGNGIVGDMCVHVFDMTRWLLDLGWPESISSQGGIYVDTDARSNIPDTQSASFNYDGLVLNWTHRTWGDAPEPDYPWGAIVYGSQGTLKIDFTKCEFVPRGGGDPTRFQSRPNLEEFPSDQADNQKWDVDLIGALGSRDLMKDWIQAIDEKRLPVADIEQGHISSASCLLANLSRKVGRTLHWDAAKHVVGDDPEATRQLKRPYRKPWVHPADAPG